MSRKNITDQLRAALEESGLSLRDLEAESGVPRGSISRFLRRERDIYLETAARLAALLDFELRPRGRRRK